MADITMKRGDTRPKLVRSLQQTIDGQTSPIDLRTATTVTLMMKQAGGLGSLLGGACTITDAANGQVMYTWTTPDTATTASYSLEFQITWSDGGIETVPNTGYFTLDIVEDLD